MTNLVAKVIDKLNNKEEYVGVVKWYKPDQGRGLLDFGGKKVYVFEEYLQKDKNTKYDWSKQAPIILHPGQKINFTIKDPDSSLLVANKAWT